jgi:hypothetical protein
MADAELGAGFGEEGGALRVVGTTHSEAQGVVGQNRLDRVGVVAQSRQEEVGGRPGGGLRVDPAEGLPGVIVQDGKLLLGRLLRRKGTSSLMSRWRSSPGEAFS